jgi:hypothetical protein
MATKVIHEPKGKKSQTKKDYQLEIAFTNGEVGVYDCRQLLEFGVFRELKDENYFRQVKVVEGTVAWPHEQDICPDTLYIDSKKTKVNSQRVPSLRSG